MNIYALFLSLQVFSSMFSPSSLDSYNMYSTTSLLLTYHDLHSFLLVASKSDGFFLGSLDSNDHVHTIESVQ